MTTFVSSDNRFSFPALELFACYQKIEDYLNLLDKSFVFFILLPTFVVTSA